MSETISLDLLGSILRSQQAELRTLRTQIELLDRRMDGTLTRDEAREMMRAVLRHLSTSEARVETRFDALNARFDALETLLRKGSPQ